MEFTRGEQQVHEPILYAQKDGQRTMSFFLFTSLFRLIKWLSRSLQTTTKVYTMTLHYMCVLYLYTCVH